MKKSILWFRQDLRISDNPALTEATKSSEKIAAIYIHDEESAGVRLLGSASKWWLHYALKNLSDDLKQNYNIELYIFKGKSETVLKKIISENKIDCIYWNRLYEPYYIERDKKIKATLSEATLDEAALGVKIFSFSANLLNEPWEIKNGSGGFYKVYTAYYKYCLASRKPRDVLKAPRAADKGYRLKDKGIKLDELKLRPVKPNWAKSFYDQWKAEDISENAAQNRLYDFLENAAADYKFARDFPVGEYTSKLSPYLHFGQISPHQVLSVCEFFEAKNPKAKDGVNKFIAEVYWREFAYHLLYHHPIHEKNFNEKFDKFPWEENKKGLKAWQHGKTGYPIVDAGMREMWATGWMHNRVRMIVGSFLTKDLIMHWKNGEEWFWDTLLDADLANNSASWQWVAGSGADAAPYFRIFNPVTQGEKFDSKGEYVRKWIPELKNMPDEYVHKPWEAPELVLSAAGVELGKNYPLPIVDHKKARENALKAFAKTKG